MNAATLLATALIITRISGEISEDSYANTPYSSNVNFNEIFSNSLSMLADDVMSVTKDEDFHLNPLVSQFAEFRLPSYTTSTRPPTTPSVETPTTTPKPRFPRKNDLEETTTTDHPSTPLSSTTTTTTTTTTTQPTTTTSTTTEDIIRVIPMKNYQRGVLDLILPASRVKNFKDVFETFRRLLSYTF